MPQPDPDKTKAGASKTSEDRRKKDVIEMARSLKGGHELASMFTGLQSILITDDQALLLAEPAFAVCKKYNLNLNAVLGPEFQLATIAAMVYGPMLRNLQTEVEHKRQEALRTANVRPRTPADGNVVYPPFRPETSQEPPPPPETIINFDVPAGMDGPQPHGGIAGE